MKINGYIFGVGFLLFSKKGNGIPRLYTVRELESKPQYHKHAGMESFPLETYEKKDGNLEGTAKRLLDEEIGITSQEVESCCLEKTRFNLIPGRKDIFIVYGYGIFTGDPEKIPGPKDKDVVFAGWATPSELLKKYIRVETSPILCHFFENHSHKIGRFS